MPVCYEKNLILIAECAIFDKKGMDMDFGYAKYIAVTLAVAATIKAKAQPDSPELNKEKAQVADSSYKAAADYVPAEDMVSNHIVTEKDVAYLDALKAAQAAATQNDSVLQEKIYQSIAEIEHDAVRFIAHFENIKMNAYWDKVARKWTIGFGNIKHPNGKPVRSGDRIKDEPELMFYFRDYFRQHIVPSIAKYLPTWFLLDKQQKIALVDMFWNAGSGQGVLSNKKEYDGKFLHLSERQRQEVANKLAQQDQSVVYQDRTYSLSDLPEWRNLGVACRTALTSLYSNNGLTKGYKSNPEYEEKWSICNEEQRRDICETLLRQKALKESSSAPYAVQLMPEKWNMTQVNDSTIRYAGFVAENDYTLSDVPAWYLLKPAQQQKLSELLTHKNDSVTYQGKHFENKDVPSWYFLNKAERDSISKVLPKDVLVRKSGDSPKKAVLSNLGYELNAYALTKTPEAGERVATRLASYIHSRGKEVPALQKRANIRAMVFLGEIELNGSGDNSINLEDVHIGASYALKIEDLNNAKTVCDTVNSVTAGKNFADTMQTQVRPMVRIRTGSRGR